MRLRLRARGPLDPHVPGLTWCRTAEAKELRRRGYVVLDFADVQRRIQFALEPRRRVALERPAEDILATFEDNPRVAVLGLPEQLNGELRVLYGYVLEPAWRCQTDLLIVADQTFEELAPAEAFVEPEFRYPWTLERIGYLIPRYLRRPLDGLPPMTPIEEMLNNALRAAGLMPRAQYGIGPYRVDFALTDVGIAIEADGKDWHDPARDRARDTVLESDGWRVMRFTGSQIYRDAQACAEAVRVERSKILTAVPRATAVEPDAPVPDSRSLLRRLLFWIQALLGRQNDRGASASESGRRELVAERDWLAELDPSQRRAVVAGDGVVQVIAPAGSGKTKTIVARVQELLARGVPANRVLCCTFNKAAAAELASRLASVAAEAVETRSLSAVGWRILERSGLLRNDVRQASYREWSWLARQAMRATANGVWIDPADAQSLISGYKLTEQVSPKGAAANLQPGSSAIDRTGVELYRLYQQMLEDKGLRDFDDLIAIAVSVLRTDEAARIYWQSRYDCVLVDEYQDIEPSQELLVQLLAAPQDSLYCVGDEDQCIYAWRRASVRRIVDLDHWYPGLERHALEINYRCAERIVVASRRLIENNRDRFPKEIRPRQGASEGTITQVRAVSLDAQAAHAARLVEGAARGEVVILARSTRVLREVAIACARRSIRCDAPERILARSGVHGVLLAYLRLFADPGVARTEDVEQVFRVPNRYLPSRAAEHVAVRLRRGLSFSQAIAGLGGELWRQSKLDQGAVLLDRVAEVSAAAEFISLIRREGGLDGHYSQAQQLNSADQSAVDSLERAENRAGDMTVEEFADAFDHETRLLESHLDAANGIELRTIHGAKGLEWPHVILVGCDDGEMPHQATLRNADIRLEAIEDERRLAYVAFTRAKEHLTVLCDQMRPSPFIAEATLGELARLEVAHEDPASVANARPLAK